MTEPWSPANQDSEQNEVHGMEEADSTGKVKHVKEWLL